MKNRYDEVKAKELVRTYSAVPEDLALRVYTSRLIGKDPHLVLHGGGNTSVKLRKTTLVGEERDVLFVKGSGIDLAEVEPSGFAGLELEPLRKLRHLESLSDEEMENQLQVHKISQASPDPSVETLVHAFLPHKYVDHTHADSILALTHQRHGEDLLKEVLGPRIGILPYLSSGLPLAKGMLTFYERHPEAEGIVILNHGIVTFAEDAKTSFERMLETVSKADSFIERKTKGKSLVTPRADLSLPKDPATSSARFVQVVRGACAFPAGEGTLRRFYAELRNSPGNVEVSLAEQAQPICGSGVITPDHAIHTKNRAVYIDAVPEDDEDLQRRVKESVDAYKVAYDQYVSAHVGTQEKDRGALDPCPRVFLVAGIGMVTLGVTRKAARIAADLAEHTVQVKLRSMALGEYQPLSESHVFHMEHWGLQRKKLGKASPPLLQGQVAVVTGGGGAIGLGVADQLLANGAAVVISDVDESRLKKVHTILTTKFGEDPVEKVAFDVTDYESVVEAFHEVSRRLGGIDILVPNAGVAHVAKIEDLDPGDLKRVVSVNLMGTFNVIRASIPIFKRQGTGGNIVVISSKNVFDPGAAFGAYSASKAAAHQISKIAALELAEIGVRVNLVNPDAVFGDDEVSSKLWDVVGAERMKSRGLDPEGLKAYYRQRNLLKAHVLAKHVGNAVVFFASNQTPTTGATLPVDGGIPAAFPR